MAKKHNTQDKVTIGYMRVSTEEQANDGQSLGVQETRIKSYCEFSGLSLDCILRDAGISGSTIDKRPGVKDLLDMVRAGKVSDVVVLKLDRLGRNVIDLLTMVEEFNANGVRFHSVNERIDTDTPMGKMFLRLLATFAEFERDMIAERTRAAMRQKKLNHERVGRFAQFGYKIDGADLVEDETELAAMAVAVEIRDSHKGWGLRRIAQRLEERGFVGRTGKRYTPSSVQRLLASG